MSQPSQPGFYYGVAFDDYRSWPAVNFSLLKEMDKTPMHCAYRRSHPSEATEEMEVGGAAHCRILEPDKWDSRFYVCPPCKLNSKEGKAIMADAILAAKGRTIVRMEHDTEASAAEAMAESLSGNSVAESLINDIGRTEVSALWFDEMGQQWCKGRFDKLNVGVTPSVGDPIQPTIVEIKTSSRLDDFAFSRTARNLHYDAQAAWYCWGHVCITGETAAHRIIVIESHPPHTVRVMELDEPSMQGGATKYSRWYGEYCKCTKRGQWPGWPEKVQKLSVPQFGELDLVVGGKEY